ncbi:MAG: ankyrin repeat domain-containing protein, partial [Kiritimatiellia bacterium]|nr:ankyrin repeat domain-containing protein [Kiritimatiellia bacterium]
MKQLLITTIAAVVLVGCGVRESAPAPEAKPEPTTAKAPDISIHDAAYEGNIEAVKQHLVSGADVNAKTGVGETPMQIAYQKGHTEIVELLIANGADGN